MNDVLRPERKGMRRVRGAEKVVLGSERKGMRRVRGAWKSAPGSGRMKNRAVFGAQKTCQGDGASGRCVQGRALNKPAQGGTLMPGGWRRRGR